LCAKQSREWRIIKIIIKYCVKDLYYGGGAIISYKYKLGGIVIVFIIILIILFFYYCSINNSTDLQIEPDSSAYAYLEVFKDMVGDMKEPYFLIFNRIKYIGVDTPNILYENPSDIKTLLEDYANKHGVSLIWDKKRMECDYNFYQRGWLIIFDDIELTETKLETKATWMGAVVLASETVHYIVERDAGKWTITYWEITRVS